MSLPASLSAAFAARPDPVAVPAASVAVLVAEDEVTAAWGAENGTLFQAASISKPVAALMALRLAAQGRLSLDADVNEYLTSWQLPGENGMPSVTVRHLPIRPQYAGMGRQAGNTVTPAAATSFFSNCWRMSPRGPSPTWQQSWFSSRPG